MSDADLDNLLNDAMDDIDLDALLDDAVNDIVPPAPVLQPKPPVAAAPTAVALNNPVAKSLSNAGLPAEVATRWATIIVADQRSQTRLSEQRPFSRAYKAWEDKGYADPGAKMRDSSAGNDASGNTAGGSPAGGWSGGSAAQKGRALFGEVLQGATSQAKLKPKSSSLVTAALHGKGADQPMVNKLQQLYLDCLAKDATPRLRNDPDRKAAHLADPTRFPHINGLLDGKA